MNAYELADWLDRRREAYEPNGWASDMLRQQADRIAELEKRNWDLVSEPWGFDRYTKPLSDLEQDACFNRGYKEGIRDTLARTPQTKPLSDEEIQYIASNLIGGNQSYNILFARAIEAKVRGEK